MGIRVECHKGINGKIVSNGRDIEIGTFEKTFRGAFFMPFPACVKERKKEEVAFLGISEELATKV